MTRLSWRPPTLSLRFFAVWRRNLLVWRKLAISSILGNLADPAFYMLGLGYGLGRLLPDVGGMSYMMFLAGGTLCYSTMNAASFEALYSGFSRMHVQKTWDAIILGPLDLDDVLLGEFAWTITKSLLSGVAILAIIWAMGLYVSFPASLGLLGVALLCGYCFAGMGLVMTALSPSYDFFLYYFTLVVTPMVLMGGVFFPTSELPAWLQAISGFLPLTHAIELARPLLMGQMPPHIVTSAVVLLGYGSVGFYVASVLTRRRLLS